MRSKAIRKEVTGHKKTFLSLFFLLAMIFSGFSANFLVVRDAFADPGTNTTQGDQADGDKKCIETSVLGKDGKYCEEADGDGIYAILLIVFNVLTAGVGVLAVVGMVIAGIQYQTSAGNEQQMAKAKSRILQIVIGLVAYALMYVGLNFLLPGGLFKS